jgi:hypothetical protein
LRGEEIRVGIVPMVQHVERFIEPVFEGGFVASQYKIRRMRAEEVFVTFSHIRKEPFSIYGVKFQPVENVIEDELREFVSTLRDFRHIY